MITIDQLLESVDLDFEPRWVTKDEDETVGIWTHRPLSYSQAWHRNPTEALPHYFRKLKLAEFDGKDWTECIYEVPRKTYEQDLEKLRPADSDLVYRVKLPRKTTGKIKKIEVYGAGTLADYKFNPTEKFEPMCFMTLIQTINTLVDAVNELKGAKND